MNNKYQEAIKELKEFVHSELDGTRMLNEYLKRCDTLQELVDKETPMKVIEFNSEITNSEEAYTFYVCPKCKMLLSNDNYCPKCGQKLDWSEE